MKLRNLLCTTLLLTVGLISNAQADRGYPHQAYREHHGYRGHYNTPHHNHHSHWGVPATVLAITGLAIGAAAYQNYQSRPTYVYSAPPQPAPVAPPPDTGNWYFCNSSRNYYPYVRVCPEGWQAVAPPR